MAWTKGFDPFASIWCKKCGVGDSIEGTRKVEVEEYFSVDDIESPDSGIDEEHEQVLSVAYHCKECGATADDIDEIATVSQHEAHNAFVAKYKPPSVYTPQEPDDDSYYGDDPYNGLGDEEE